MHVKQMEVKTRRVLRVTVNGQPVGIVLHRADVDEDAVRARVAAAAARFWNTGLTGHRGRAW